MTLHKPWGGLLLLQENNLGSSDENKNGSFVSKRIMTEGNTKPQSKSKKREKLGNRFCFTWNNYDENWLDQLDHKFKGFKWKGGVEVGDSGTPHIQGYLESEFRIRPIEKFGIKAIHWEKAKGNRQQNITYCSKEGKVYGNLPDVYVPECTEPWGWGLHVQGVVEAEICPRSVDWYYEPEGKTGKSDVVRWLVIKHGAMICSGKAADMKFQIMNHYIKTGEVTRNVVFDVPRSMEKYISYSGMEEIKNGVFASSKYESGVYVGPRPRLFVFANFEPNPGVDLSEDRLRVHRIVVKKEKGEVVVSQIYETSSRMLQNMLVENDKDTWDSRCGVDDI